MNQRDKVNQEKLELTKYHDQLVLDGMKAAREGRYVDHSEVRKRLETLKSKLKRVERSQD